MKLFLVTAICVIALAGRGADVSPVRSCIPVEVLEEDGYDWHERHAEKLRAVASRSYDIILMGDSITHYWETAHGPRTWAGYFGGRNVLNLGFGWDRTGNLLWRLENGELSGQKPKLFVLNIGTNNFSRTRSYAGDSPEETASGIIAVARKVHALSPTTRIVVMEIFPRLPESRHAVNRETNALLRRKAKQYPWLNVLSIEKELTAEDGKLKGTSINIFLTEIPIVFI